MNTPARSSKSPFASEEEEGAFKAAQRQFVGEGRLDAWKALLTSGKSLSPRIGVEIARLLTEGQNQPGKLTTQSRVAYALIVKAFKGSPGRPPVLDKQARLEAGAQEVWNRVNAGERLTDVLKQVRKESRLSPNELRQEVRKLEECRGETLLRWPPKSERTKKLV